MLIQTENAVGSQANVILKALQMQIPQPQVQISFPQHEWINADFMTSLESVPADKLPLRKRKIMGGIPVSHYFLFLQLTAAVSSCNLFSFNACVSSEFLIRSCFRSSSI